MKYITFCCLFLTGCSIFSTRDPENPTSVRSSFTPPTSAQIVVSNFKSALLEKNTENYIQCFSDTSKGARQTFIFEPSASVNAQYPSLFLHWSIANERQAFLSMINKVATDAAPVLQLTDDRYEVTTPDSTVYQAEYVLKVSHDVQTVPTQVRGFIRLTIASQSGGLWTIVRWSDSSPTVSDSLNSTWSLLKAKFSN